MMSDWPQYDESWNYPIAENIAEHYKEIIRGIRNVRAEMNVPKNRKATAYVVCEDAQLCTGLEMLRQAAQNMAAVNDLIIQHDTVGIPEDAVSIVVPDATVYLPLEELIDFDQELERLTKEEARLAKEIARAEGMLSNEKFVSKAPEAKVQEEREKLDPATQKPVLDKDGKPVTETVEVTRPAFKVVSVFDVSQTDGKELPDIAVDELTGSVENYAAFFDALKALSPVHIDFENITDGAKGYFSHVENRIAIQEGMSEIQTIKTAIHEIAHAKLHAVTPGEKVAPEDKKDRRTKEVEAESVAYTVCQRYGIETSDYSFGYIAGWSSDKETKELKGSLETIRKTAAEMITGIDEKLKERLAVKEQEAPTPLRDAAIPVYREAAMYAFEAGELSAYRTSMQANMDCKEAIEQTINDYYGNKRLAAESAVKSILEKFSPERVAYVLANTIQQKDHDGRISRDCKEWAKGMDASPDHATQLIIDSVNPGLVSLFTEEFVRQTAIGKAQEQTPAEQSKTAVPEEGPEAPAPKEPEQAVPVKHRLTPEEKKIKEAVMDTLKAQIAGRNDGMLSTYRSSNQSFKVMMEYKVRIEGNTVTRDGEPMFAIHRRHSAKKVQGCYRELTPMLEYIGKEKTQEAAREKPSIREQLRAAAKSQPERKAPVKQKSRDAGLE